MKMKYLYIVLSLASMAVLSSCGDFLKEASQDEFEPKNVESYQELLNGTGYSTITTLDPLTHIMTDDVMGCKANSYAYTETNIAYKAVFTWQSSMDATLQSQSITSATKSYQDIYKLIMTCNLVVENLDDVSGTKDEYNQTMGEAKALRALYYWYLVNMYAKPYNMAGTTPDKLLGVPLITKSEIKDEGPTRNTVAEVYAQIVKDIEDACTLLDQEKTNTVSLFRINYVAAHLLASRIYLYTENWDKVIEHANAALAGAPSLTDLNTYTFSNPNYPFNSTNEVLSKSFPEVIHINGAHLYDIPYAGTPICISTELINTFDDTDLRKTAYFYKQGSWSFYPYLLAKRGISEQDFAWRTSEIYLNRAEAYAAKFAAGDQTSGQKAVEDLNTLRKSRYKTGSYSAYVLTTAADLTTFLRAERRRELSLENPHRWFDLRRYGMPSIRHQWYDATGVSTYYTLKQGDPGYVLPIPTAAMTQNTNLVQNELAPERTAETE
jgi:hypothetical protein